MVVQWRRLDQPGTEWCRLRKVKGKSLLEGIALFHYESRPCRLDYHIECDSMWRTLRAVITGQIGTRTVGLIAEADSSRHWTGNGKAVPAVDGCVDIDLGFSPSTNLLPIKRLKPKLGRTVEVTAAWVEFPSLKLKPLRQSYTRIDTRVFHYESEGGRFQRDLEIDDHGFITRYPGIWEMEASS